MTTRAEKEARLERGREVLRREGRADAVLILVAKKFRPGLTLDDYAQVLDVSHLDLQRAIARRRGPRPAPTPAPTRGPRAPGVHVCPELGCDASYDDRRGLAAHRRAAHTELVVCPGGCGRMINPAGLGPHSRFCTGPIEATGDASAEAPS